MLVKDFKEQVNNIPESRDNDIISVYNLDDGNRVTDIRIDIDCSDVVDINFSSYES